MNQKTLNQKDLEKIFVSSKKSKPSKIKTIIKYILLFIVLFIAIYVLINYRSLYARFIFWYKANYQAEIENYQIDVSSTDVNDSGTIDNFYSSLDNNNIYIPSINITAPVLWNINNTDEEVQAALKNGVIHLSGTALPGEIGNVFITGHSSFYPWSKGQYKEVFALLDKVVSGDQVVIRYENNIYIYIINDRKVVKNNDLSVLDQRNESEISLMTCTPIGTSIKRLIISGRLYYPNLNSSGASPYINN